MEPTDEEHAMSQDTGIRPEQGVAPARRALTVAALALPVLLIAIDISVMGVALPRIAEALRPSAAELLWIIDSYNYLVAATMLTMGAVADRFGRRRVIVLCAWVFALASVVGAFAPNALWLIVARAVMGVAGSAIFPASMAVIGGLYSEQTARVRAFGAFMTIFLGGMTVAPFVGGLLLHGFWWGSVLLVGAPVMVVAAVAVPLLTPESRSEQPPRVDVLSTAQSAAAILLVVAAVKAFATDDPSPLAWVSLVVGSGKLTQPRAKLKESGRMDWVEDFSDGQVKGIGALELLGAVGLVLPWALGVAKVLTPIAALGLTLVMGGAVVTHLRRKEQSAAAVPAVLGALAVIVAVLRFTQL
jgi:MFS family permease